MILKRLGNKQALAKELEKYFPEHTVYIELFFGAGGMFFNKKKAQYNIMNDIDSEVINLYNVIMDNKEEFLELLEITPYTCDLFDYWKKNKEMEPLKKALRFLYLSNYAKFGKFNYAIRFGPDNSKRLAIENLQRTVDFLKDCSVRFMNYDFRKAIKRIDLIHKVDLKNMFIYCDPPYLGCGNNYNNVFYKKDFIDLLDCLQDKGCKFAVSEFNNEFIMEQAKARNLYIYIIKERRTIKSRNTEILVTNYKAPLSLFEVI